MDNFEQTMNTMDKLIEQHEHKLKLIGVVASTIEWYQAQYNITQKQARCLMSEIARDQIRKAEKKPKASNILRTIRILITEGNKRFSEGRIPKDCEIHDIEDPETAVFSYEGDEQDGGLVNSEA
jgi:hypothetical protein